jgi:lysyl-tRNA synthetase, class I
LNKEFSVHWLEDIIKEISNRKPEQITLATGKTPSGHVHLGILREILICEALRKKFTDKDENVDFFLFLDDFDAAKRFPDYIDKQFQREHLGKPFSLIPCPENNCGCESYGHHYGDELTSTFRDFGIETKIIWSFKLYQTKEMQAKIRIALENNDLIKKILKKYILPTLDEEKQKSFLKMQETWMPAMVLCEKCNRIQKRTSNGEIIPNRVLSYLKEEESVSYTCPVCGFSNIVPLSSGKIKLNWRVDWPAKWALFNTTCEPAGKDHSVKGGAYDTGLEICQKIYNYEGPVKVPYEWLRLGDQDMKTSKGIVFTPKKYLEIADPEIYRMLIYRTNPMKHISLRIEELPQYYDYFEKVENVYYNIEKLESKEEEGFMKYLYELTKIKSIPAEKQPKISFDLLLFLTQIQNLLPLERLYEKALSWAEDENSLPSLEMFESLLQRTANWVNEVEKIIKQKYDEKKQNFVLNKLGIFSIPKEVNQKIFNQLGQTQISALRNFKNFLLTQRNLNSEIIQNEIFNISKQIEDLPPKDLFKAFYLIILGKISGPRLGPFIMLLGKDWILNRLQFLDN